MSYNQRRTIGTGVPAVGKQFLSKLIKDFIFYNHSGLVSSLPTTSRTTDLIVPDHEGILRTFGNGEVGIEGGRVVENLIDFSEDFTSGGWSTTNATVTSDQESGPNGLADRISFSTGGINQIFQNFTTVDGATYSISAWIKADSSETLQIGFGGVGGSQNDSISVTTEWQRFSTTQLAVGTTEFPQIAHPTGVSLNVYVTGFQLENVTAQANQNPSEYQPVGTPTGADLVTNGGFTEWADSTVPDGWTKTGTHNGSNYVEENAAGLRLVSDGTYVAIRLLNITTLNVSYYYEIVVGTVTSGSVSLVTESTTVDTFSSTGTYTGTFSALGTPVELKRGGGSTDIIVTSLTLYEATTGQQVYATANGNTVASNVVTEATGASLSPAPAVYCEPAHTNLVTYSHEIDNANWGKTNVSVTANDAIAPDGTLTADKITGDSGDLLKSVTCPTITTSETTEYTLSFYLKKATSIASVYTNTWWENVDYVNIDTSDGSTQSSSAFPSVDVSSFNDDWWKVVITGNTLGGGSGLSGQFSIGLVDDLADARGATATTTDNIHVWGAQFELGGAATSYIPTSGATATANATEPVVTWPSGLVNDFVVKCTYITNADSADYARVIVTVPDGANEFEVNRQAGNNSLDFSLRSGGTQYKAIGASVGTWGDGTEITLTILMSSVNGMAIWTNGANKQTNSNTIGMASSPSQLMLMNHSADLTKAITGTIRDVKIFKVSPTISDAQVLAL